MLCKADKGRNRDARKHSTGKQLKLLNTTKIAFQNALGVDKCELYDRSTKCNIKILRKISKKVPKVR